MRRTHILHKRDNRSAFPAKMRHIEPAAEARCPEELAKLGHLTGNEGPVKFDRLTQLLLVLLVTLVALLALTAHTH